MKGFGSERIWKRKDLEVNGFGSERIWKRTDLEAKGFGSERFWKRNDLEVNRFGSGNTSARAELTSANLRMCGSTCVTKEKMANLSLLLVLFDVGLSALPRSPTGASSSSFLTKLIVVYFLDGYQYRMILTWLCL